jgi:hypothetical protein
MIALIIGALVLPLLLWSWRRTGNDDDANLALGIIGWIALLALVVTLFVVLP